MARIDQLRAEAKAIRKNLTTKVSRIAKVDNVHLAGTKLDPRQPAADINNMNARQLNSYLRTARTFLKRETGFVRGLGGKPLPKVEWRALEKSIRTNNKFANSRLMKYSDIVVPGSGLSIGEREGIRSNSPRMRNRATNRPVNVIDITNAEGFASVEKMRRFRKKIDQRATETHVNRSIKKTRKTAEKTYKIMGDKRMVDWLKTTSDEMLDLLWNYGGLAESTYTRYENMKAAEQLHDLRGFDKVADDADSDLEETIKWAATFDRFKKS